MRPYEAIAELVSRTGVDTVFAMVGHTNVAWLAHGQQHGLFEVVKTRHEEVAGNAAFGHSWSTGNLGIFTVVRGPGFANSINALTAATKSHVPVLLVVAESPATGPRWTTQNINQREHTEAIGAGFHHAATPDELEKCFQQAVSSARWNGCPQVVSIADAVMEAEEVPLSDAPMQSEPPPPTVDDDALHAAVDALQAATQPLILAGRGAVLANCHAELVELADLTGARVANTLAANCFFAGHPRDLGLCGTWSPEPARAALAENDLVLAFGASLNQKTLAEGTLFGGARVIQCEVDVDQPFRATRPEYGLMGDASLVAQALIREWRRRDLPARAPSGATPPVSAIRAAIMPAADSLEDDGGIDLRHVYATMDRKLPATRTVVTDSGSSLGTLPNLVGAASARRWIVGRAYGSVGLGLGIALGAAAADPEHQVAAFIGDGGFMMALSALDSFRLHDLRNVFIGIMNNEAYGSEFRPLDAEGLPRDVVRQPLPDIPTLARAYGGVGTVVRTAREVDDLELLDGTLQIVDFRISANRLGRAVFA